MRMHLPTALGLAALLVATTACSSGGSQPAQVQNYGPAAGAASSTTGGVARAPSRAPAYAPSTAPVGGPITWHTRLADAQAQARASGKLILVTSTKPRCSLCKKFKDQVAPAAGAELTRMAVGYIYDITRPEVRDVDRLLRANLRGADLMPLVGFITADLQWVHGFWGQRSVQQFRGDIARATSIHPVRTAALDPRAAPYQGDLRVQPATAAAAPRLGMVVNEYGEKEWGSAADIWPEGDPEPIDAITGAPAGLPTTVPAASGPGSPGVMLADATTTPTADPAPRPEAPVPAGAGLPALPPSNLPAVGPAANPPAATPTVADRTPAAPAATPTVREPQDDESWGRRELQRALMLIRAGDFDSARSALAQVKDRLPDSSVAREAGKGGVALYNAKRIRFASSGAERSRYLDRARRDFGNSMWAPLFNS